MIKRIICRMVLFGSILSIMAVGQTATDDPEPGLRAEVHPTIADSYLLSWWGKSGHTYFLQHSTDLTAWTNLDLMETGEDAVMSYGFTSTAVADFWRVSWIDEAPVDPDNADFDGDGLTNAEELATTLTDPLKRDTDGDGLPDGWEIMHGFDPLIAATSEELAGDGDSDGLNLLQESQADTDPTELDTDGDGMPDGWEVLHDLNPVANADAAADDDDDGVSNLQEFLNGTDPRDYFDGDLRLTAQNSGRPGEDDVLVVDVKQDDGAPWVNAPVTFRVAAGERRISATLGGPTYADSVLVHTDANGQARVYLEPLAP
ncbi:MAG: hypothetical protein KA257_00450 [Opitutaceae bacterium]|nr:hypothetical protein [Opitutaceae bacterium]MBP9911845.1 hypothetical protein [Opitutaceae bacterium]